MRSDVDADNRITARPGLIVFSSLFPSSVRPGAGLFIRERMFRVGKQLPIIVVSPVPWFPLQNLIRYWRPNFRPQPALFEEQQGIKVYYPRFFSFPGWFKQWDGFFMAIGSWALLRKIRADFDFNLIDAHFAYPDGYAATLLGKWFRVPVTITLRGTEVPHANDQGKRKRMLAALGSAAKVFAVADSLKKHVVQLGADGNKIEVIGNGIDTDKFYPIDKLMARDRLKIPETVKVIVSVGALVDRKGFHRVLEIMPGLLEEFPGLVFLIVGGDSPEGGIRQRLEAQVTASNLQEHVRFLGALPAEELKTPLSAADVFVLATANEGWANVFLEAMACGLPVVTTDVGGNREVVNSSELGSIVPFGDPSALLEALREALRHPWNKDGIVAYANANQWDKRVYALVHHFRQIIKH